MEATKGKRGRKPRGEVLGVVLVLKGRPEWRDWVESNAETLGLSVTEMVDQALRDQAKRKKLPAPPARLFEPKS